MSRIVRTTFSLTVLHEAYGADVNRVAVMDLAEIAQFIDTGDGIGQLVGLTNTVMDPADVRAELIALGNDGEFFDLSDDYGAGPDDDGNDDGYQGADGHWLVSRRNDEDGDTPGRAYLYEARFNSEARASDYLGTSASIDPDALKAGDYSLEYVSPDTFIAGEPILYLQTDTTALEAEVVKNLTGDNLEIRIKGEADTLVDRAERMVSLWTNGSKTPPVLGTLYQFAYPYWGGDGQGNLCDTTTYPELSARRGKVVIVKRWATLEDCDREAMPQVIIGDPEGGDPDFESVATPDELVGPDMTLEQVIAYIIDHFVGDGYEGKIPTA